MTTVVFVHGTGGRAASYESAFSRVEHELFIRRPDLSVARCLWGDTLGAKLHLQGASIPRYETARGIGETEKEYLTKEDEEFILWSLLYQDPLYELRLIALTNDTASGKIVLGRFSPGDELDEFLRGFAISPSLESKLSEMGIETVFSDARNVVVTSTPYREVLGRVDSSTPGIYRCAVARAMVAQAIVLCEQQKQLPVNLWDASLRDEIVALLLIAMDDTERSIIGKVATLIVAPPVTWYMGRKRGKFSDNAFPYAGDILLYQVRGEPIRQFIGQQIEQASPPVVLLAHSLGGIACVDLLAQSENVRKQVHLLVTVGTQAPFFYEIGALQSLLPGQPLPLDFPSWLNIYDLNDFLSYIGAAVFPGRVEDVCVNNRQPFPQSHSAYWTNPGTWDAVLPKLP